MPSNESIKDYNVYEQLGQGGFAQVYRAQVKESSKEVAIKMVSARFFLFITHNESEKALTMFFRHMENLLYDPIDYAADLSFFEACT